MKNFLNNIKFYLICTILFIYLCFVSLMCKIFNVNLYEEEY